MALAGGATAYPLLRLRIDPRRTATFLEPAGSAQERSRRVDPTLADVTGVYSDGDGRVYVVDLVAGPEADAPLTERDQL